MKNLIITLISLFFAVLSFAETRSWTSAKGSIIEAELVNHEKDRVTLKKSDGGFVKIRESGLSKEDQVYLKEEREKREAVEKAEEVAKAAEAVKAELALLGFKTGLQEVELPKSLNGSELMGPKYLLYLPNEYGVTGDKMPLMLFLHGAGERGTDVKWVGVHGPIKMLKKQEFPFIIIAPQCQKDKWWNPAEIMKLVEHTEKTLNVDKDRIYITGLSMGGFGTWGSICRYPNKFAAAIPVCGGGDPLQVASIKDLPIWVFHGDADGTVGIEKSQVMVDALKKLKSDVIFTVYPGVGHDSWSKTYSNPDVYDWMLQQRR